MFEDPIDFMVYLHLFTYSWGFKRETVDMGLTQLERFTGASRNTIRKSLERLTARKWITEVQKQEPGRISRKWKVRNPSPKPEGPTGSKSDPVKNEPGQRLTPRGSNSDPVTGSKIDPYKKSSKQSFKETLSLETEELREYFAAIRVPRKRESERAACRELLGAYSEHDVATALRHLQTHGIGEGGTKSHSPMAYLAKAMDSVLATARNEARVSEQRKATVEAAMLAREAEQEQREREDREAAAQLRSFCDAYPDGSEREAAIEELTPGMALLGKQARLALAAQRWG